MRFVPLKILFALRKLLLSGLFIPLFPNINIVRSSQPACLLVCLMDKGLYFMNSYMWTELKRKGKKKSSYSSDNLLLSPLPLTKPDRSYLPDTIWFSFSGKVSVFS